MLFQLDMIDESNKNMRRLKNYNIKEIMIYINNESLEDLEKENIFTIIEEKIRDLEKKFKEIKSRKLLSNITSQTKSNSGVFGSNLTKINSSLYNNVIPAHMGESHLSGGFKKKTKRKNIKRKNKKITKSKTSK